MPTEELETDKNDVAAFAAMLYMFPDYLKMKGSSRMVYNETTGRWDEEYIGTLYNIAKKVHSANDYGTSVRKMRDLFELMYTLPDDTAFFDSASEKAIGKLLFPNGIYDKRAGKRTGFTQEVYFRFAVPHAMPDSAPANVAKVDAFHFTDPFPEPGVASWLRQSMMKAVFGLGSDTVTFECGGGSNGKSTRFAGFRTAFGNHLVHTFDGKDLCVDKFKNPGGASPHLMPLAHVRLAYVSDPDPDMVLNMSLIKKTTGGDTLSCRGLNKGIEVFRSYAKFHFLVNRVPKFSECESSQLERRLHHLESDTIWTKKADQVDVSSRILLADAKLTEEVLASVDSLIWIMINEPLQDVPVPKSVELQLKLLILHHAQLLQQRHHALVVRRRSALANPAHHEPCRVACRQLRRRRLPKLCGHRLLRIQHLHRKGVLCPCALRLVARSSLQHATHLAQHLRVDAQHHLAPFDASDAHDVRAARRGAPHCRRRHLLHARTCAQLLPHTFHQCQRLVSCG